MNSKREPLSIHQLGDDFGVFNPEKVQKALAELYLEFENEPEQFAAFLDILGSNGGDINRITAQTHIPVSIEGFLDDDYFVKGAVGGLWERIRGSIVDCTNGGYVEAILTGAIGVGKCTKIDTPMIMYDGSIKLVQDIKTGDQLLGHDGLPRTVTSLARGREKMYRIKQKGGEDYTVNESHILSLKYTNTHYTRVREYPSGNKSYDLSFRRHNAEYGDIKNISVRDYLKLPKSHQNVLKGWKPDGVDFGNSVPVEHPYFIGLWLGDGTHTRPDIHTMDSEIVDYLDGLAHHTFTCLMRQEDKRGNKAARYSFVSYDDWGNQTRLSWNPVRDLLAKTNLLGNKHIPRDYLTASREDRLLLLAGLLDSDGHLCNGRNTFAIAQKRENLADQISFLARSLGFRASRSIKQVNGVDYYHVSISGDTDRIPTKIARKQAKPRQQKKDINMWGIEVEPMGEGDYYGFTLSDSDPDRLFLLGDFTVTHNTVRATIINAYQLYLLSCELFPQLRYGLMPTTDITFAMLNKTETLAKTVTYGTFRNLIEAIPYFREQFPHNLSVAKTMDFRDNITVLYAPAYADKIMGMNVMSGIVDELNFYSVVEKSKKSRTGESHDQAQEIYTSLVRRRKSRFESAGKVAGVICSVSSKGYAGDFTERRIEELKAEDDHLTYISDVAQWEMLPAVKENGEKRWSGETFQLEIGDERHNSRVLADTDVIREGAEVLTVPIEFKNDFIRDMEGALRDYAGRSTLSMRPYFANRDKIWNMAQRFNDMGGVPVFDVEITDLANGVLPEVIKNYKPLNPHVPRACHLDLAVSHDWCGLAVGHISDVKEIRINDPASDKVMFETVPEVTYDCVLGIKPPLGGEIEFSLVRQVVYLLREVAGLNIKYVSTDQFQSTDSRQILRKGGFKTTLISVEGESAYQALRTACHQDRLAAPMNERCFNELARLERDPKTGKIDHPSDGCFVGTTKVLMADGTHKSFNDLVYEYKLGIDSGDLVTYDRRTKQFYSSPFRHPRKTKMAKHLIEIEGEDGYVFRCTPDHRLLLKSGIWRRAKDLQEGDELMNCYTPPSND